MPKLSPIPLIIIALVATGLDADCFCGSPSEATQVFSFSPDSPHTLSLAAAYFESAARRFNMFNLKDPNHQIPITLSKAQSINFRRLEADLEVTMLYSLNSLLYFELNLRIPQAAPGQLVVNFREILQKDLNLKTSVPTLHSVTVKLADPGLERPLCEAFMAFIEALIIRQLNFSFLDLLAPPPKADGDLTNFRCREFKTAYMYYLPKRSMAQTLETTHQRRRRNRILAGAEDRDRLIKQVTDILLEIASLTSDRDAVEEKLFRKWNKMEAIRHRALNDDIIAVETNYAQQLALKEGRINGVIRDKTIYLNQVINEYEATLQGKPATQIQEDQDFLVKLRKSIKKGTFFELYGPQEKLTERASVAREDVTDYIGDLVQKNVEFEPVEVLKDDMKMTKNAIFKGNVPIHKDDTPAPQGRGSVLKIQARQALDEVQSQLKAVAEPPKTTDLAKVVSLSEKESADIQGDGDMRFFRKATLDTLTSQLDELEKPILAEGQPAIVRSRILDVEPNYDGGLEIEKIEDIMGDEDDEWLGATEMVYEETINDARAVSRENYDPTRQPCDKAFESIPIFEYDAYLLGLPSEYRIVNPMIELTREKRINVAEDIKLKVIFDSKLESIVEAASRDSFEGTIKRKINLMNDRLPQSPKKIQELQDWIINVVQLVERTPQLQQMQPHVRIYSDYSMFLEFEGMSQVESANFLKEFMPDEEETELEVQVELQGVTERHYLLFGVNKVNLAVRERTVAGHEELQAAAQQVIDESGF